MDQSPDAKRYVSYLRVSTKRQGESGLGLEAQRQAIDAFLNGNKWELVTEYVEIESGKRNSRPQLALAIAECKRRKATLVIARLDRLARNAAFLLTLRDGGTEFLAVDQPHADKLTIGIMAVVAEHERDMISARTRAALAAAKARGVKLGSPAPRKGSAKGVAAIKAQADDFAANTRPLIDDIRKSGINTLQGIADALNARGIPTARGGAWGKQTVANVIRRLS